MFEIDPQALRPQIVVPSGFWVRFLYWDFVPQLVALYISVGTIMHVVSRYRTDLVWLSPEHAIQPTLIGTGIALFAVFGAWTLHRALSHAIVA